MEIKAVVFDVDGTLYPNSAMYRRSVLYALKNARFIHNFSKVRKQIREIPLVKDYHELQGRMLGELIGLSTDHAKALIENRIHAWEDQLAGIPFVAGLKSFLDRLDDAGIPRGLLSDFPIDRKIKLVGLSQGWVCKVSSEEVGFLKPHAKPFQAVCEAVQLPPENILYVGNSYSYDVVGAKNSGLWAAHLARKPVKESIADVTFRDYFELGEWLFDRIGG